MPSCTEIGFDSGGQRCAARLCLPDDAAGPVPCVVLGHGMNGTRELGLDDVAEELAGAGLAAVAFDYRHFGRSSGSPRQLVDIRRQLADFAAAVAYARSLPAVDAERVALWGAALGSGHALITAARDRRIAAVVAQLPYVRPGNGPVGPLDAVQLAIEGLRDELGHRLGRPPRMIRVIDEGSGPPALLRSPELVAGFRAAVPPGADWRNEIAARFVLRAPLYWPELALRRVRCPVLFTVASHDPICSPAVARRAARRLARAELREYPISHFDLAHGEAAERVRADQRKFLSRHLLAG